MGYLFAAADLSALLQQDVDPTTAAKLEQVVWGWLRGPLGLTERPTPVPEEIFSWAIELGAIAHENPAGLASYSLGEERWAYSSERRLEILALAGAGASETGTGVPRGNFPPYVPYPDQVPW